MAPEYEPGTAIREHPWKGGVTPDVDYYEFRKHPELISEKLEDFKPSEAHAAIETFYEGLARINSESSVLESNDCAFHGPQENISTDKSSKKMEMQGSVDVSLPRSAK